MRTIDFLTYEPKGSVRRAVYDQALRIHGSHEKILRSFDAKNTEQLMALLLKSESVLIETRPILNFI